MGTRTSRSDPRPVAPNLFRKQVERTRQAVAEFEATGHVLPYEKEYLRRDGSRFWGLVGAAKLEGRDVRRGCEPWNVSGWYIPARRRKNTDLPLLCVPVAAL
jgi:hypothetical protein